MHQGLHQKMVLQKRAECKHNAFVLDKIKNKTKGERYKRSQNGQGDR